MSGGQKMKINARIFIGSMLICFGISTSCQAYMSSFFPPERIRCMMDQNNHLSCLPINRDFLTEEDTDADFREVDTQTFLFVAAHALLANHANENTIYFLYRNNDGKVVKLKTINGALRPDLENGTWTKINELVYSCEAGYMYCKITDLPPNV